MHTNPIEPTTIINLLKPLVLSQNDSCVCGEADPAGRGLGTADVFRNGLAVGTPVIDGAGTPARHATSIAIATSPIQIAEDFIAAGISLAVSFLVWKGEGEIGWVNTLPWISKSIFLIQRIWFH